MDSIWRFFLRIKHWQLFLLLFGSLLFGLVALPIWSISAPPRAIETMLATMAAITVPIMFVSLGWLWSVGSFCRTLVRPADRLNLRFFRFATIYPGLYVLLFFALFLNTRPWAIVVIFPLHLLAVFCSFYNLYFVSRNFTLATTGRASAFNDYAGPFFLLWFFPIGVWTIQPQINRLYLRAAACPPATATGVSVPASSPGAPTYAGFWRRSAAALIDACLFFFPLLFVTVLTYRICEAILNAKRYNSDWALLAWPVVFFTFTLCYSAFLESSPWQGTLGKKALGVCVSDIEKRRLTLGRAAARTLAKYVSCLTIGIGFVMCGFTKKKQALHDMIASTLVLRP